jgi:hypothetical protein
MPVPVSEYQSRLNNLENKKTIILENYKSSLINYKADPTSENKEIFDKYKNQLERDVYSNIFILKNEINKSISQNNNNIMKTDTNIDVIETQYQNKLKLLEEKKNIDLAAKPLSHETKNRMIEEYLYLGYYSIAIIAGVVFLYKK